MHSAGVNDDVRLSIHLPSNNLAETEPIWRSSCDKIDLTKTQSNETHHAAENRVQNYRSAAQGKRKALWEPIDRQLSRTFFKLTVLTFLDILYMNNFRHFLVGNLDCGSLYNEIIRSKFTGMFKQ